MKKIIKPIINTVMFLAILNLVCYSGFASEIKGCLFTPVSEIPEGKAVIYFYKTKNKKEKRTTPVYVDKVHIINPVGGGYFPFLVTPGKHRIEAGIGWIGAGSWRPEYKVQIDVEPGKEYYIEFKKIFPINKPYSMKVVQKSQALKEIKNYKKLLPYKEYRCNYDTLEGVINDNVLKQRLLSYGEKDVKSEFHIIKLLTGTTPYKRETTINEFGEQDFTTVYEKFKPLYVLGILRYAHISGEFAGGRVHVTIDEKGTKKVFQIVIEQEGFAVDCLDTEIPSDDPNKILATVNGENILQKDVNEISSRFGNQIQEEQIPGVTNQILDGLITQKLIMQFIRNNKIEPSKADIEAELNKVRKDIKSNPSLAGQTLEQVLESRGISIDDLKRDIIISLSLEKYLGKDIDDQKIKQKQEILQEKSKVLAAQLRQKAKISINKLPDTSISPLIQPSNPQTTQSTNLANTETTERAVVREILVNGVISRPVIPEIKTENGPPCSATIRAVDGTVWSLTMELPSDRIPIQNSRKIVFGDGSIHRFSGKVIFETEKLQFNGEGDATNRLTFLLLNNKGYVYVRGKGKVIYPDGKTVTLGE